MDGTREEQRLCSMFDDEGWGVMKSPASGSVDREQADILAGYPGRDDETYAIELKTKNDTRNYVTAEEVEDLRVAAAAFGAKVRLVARWGGDRTFYAYAPSSLDRTPSGNYTLRKDQRDQGTIFPPDVDADE